MDSDAQLLIKAGRAAGLSHSTHFRSGVFGAGLVTLSRHPIIRHGFWRYAASGFATSISCGDYYAGKGGPPVLYMYDALYSAGGGTLQAG